MLKFNKHLVLTSVSLIFFCYADVLSAAPVGDAYVDTYTYNVTVYEECDWNFYASIYACTAPSSYPWCINATPIDDYLRCSDCGGAGSSYATLYKSSCKNLYWCDNLPTYSPGTVKTTESRTGYTCHYVSGVNTWGACSADSGTQSAIDGEWSSFNSTSPISNCSDYQVSLSRNCGVCEPTSVNLSFVNETEVYNTMNTSPLQVCKWGTIPLSGLNAVSFPDVYGENWNWRCERDGVPSSDICTAKMSYSDIGLRIQSPLGDIRVAAETQPDSCKSPLKIYKNGQVRCIGLLPETQAANTRASKAYIKTVGGTKIITKVP